MSNDKLAEALREHVSKILADARTAGYMVDTSIDLDTLQQISNFLQAHAAEAAQAQSVPGELAEPIEGAFNYEQKLAFTEGWNACREAMLAAAPQQAAEPVRQFRVVPKGSVWTDVKDPEIWASVTAHPESYETRVLYTHPQPAQDAKLPNAEDFRLHLGELSANELRLARAAFRYAMAKESGNG